MVQSSFWNSILGGLFVGLGIAIAGFFIGKGAYNFRVGEKSVSVKGLAEREVDADLAIWPISFTETANDLGELQKNLDNKRETISRFLEDSGFKESEISHAAPRISDLQTQFRGDEKVPPKFRYVAQKTIIVRSANVALVRKTKERSGDLVGQGIVLSADNWDNPTQFFFTTLNDIKPAMIEEATKAARDAAEKFAKDSGSKISSIRRASQGLFTVEDRDKYTPERKKIRVVTSVDYSLTD